MAFIHGRLTAMIFVFDKLYGSRFKKNNFVTIDAVETSGCILQFSFATKAASLCLFLSE